MKRSLIHHCTILLLALPGAGWASGCLEFKLWRPAFEGAMRMEVYADGCAPDGLCGSVPAVPVDGYGMRIARYCPAPGQITDGFSVRYVTDEIPPRLLCSPRAIIKGGFVDRMPGEASIHFTTTLWKEPNAKLNCVVSRDL